MFKKEEALFSFECARVHLRNKSGGDSTEATPVPIPNTEVKLCNADDTWLETARESK